MPTSQIEIDQRNASFWDELCGTSMAEELGITDGSPQSLGRFDAHYLSLYPYLDRYLPGEEERGRRALEIGLGYGTVSQVLAERGLEYHGIDIAEGPVRMVQQRLARLGVEDVDDRVRVGSALEIPHPDSSFDHVVAIGCLHHTGDLARAVAETHRVLRPGGIALVMVYNRNSARQMRIRFANRLLRRQPDEEAVRGSYDHNLKGEAAPATEYVSKREAIALFGSFAEVGVRRENFSHVATPGFKIRGKAAPVIRFPRRPLLGLPARLAGLDLYITATK